MVRLGSEPIYDLTRWLWLMVGRGQLHRLLCICRALNAYIRLNANELDTETSRREVCSIARTSVAAR